MSDTETLLALARKWFEPFDENADPNKTIEQWRREFADMMTEAAFRAVEANRRAS